MVMTDREVSRRTYRLMWLHWLTRGTFSNLSQSLFPAEEPSLLAVDVNRQAGKLKSRVTTAGLLERKSVSRPASPYNQ